MARLCIRVAPNNHPDDPKLDAFRTQIGDVVCVVGDRHIFSKGEMACGQYKFVDVPGVPAEELAYLSWPALDQSDQMVRRTSYNLDPSAVAKLANSVTKDAITNIATAIAE